MQEKTTAAGIASLATQLFLLKANETSSSIPTDTILRQNRISSSLKCSPHKHILFLKTHKTGSSTIANILFRYGDSRNLIFALGGDTNVGWPRRFQVSFIFQYNNKSPNILCSHTRYNQKPMNWLFPKETSKYITILRNPVEQFESVFNYMGFGPIYGFGNNPTESLKMFLQKGIPFPSIHKTIMTHLARNPMLFDLGLSYKHYQNLDAINNYIQFLETEFDLVMITDYFDESLVLMKRLLCWELDDIVYFKLNERQDKEKAVTLSKDIKENVKRWNRADSLLFEHFNQTFWKKVHDEGQSFYEDLAAFRRRTEEVRRSCVTDKASVQFAYGKKYVKGYTLREDLSEELKVKCERLTRSENNYLTILRKKGPSLGAPKPEAQAAEEKEENTTSWDLSKGLAYTPV